MSQVILDDQIFDEEVLIPIARWTTVQRLRNLRPGEVIKDERVPVILREIAQPTFVTIDMGFWRRELVDAKYCILCFPLRNDEQGQIPDLLRRLFRLPEFHTKAARMGKVVQVTSTLLRYWQRGDEQLHLFPWLESGRR
ncbi:MAG: hypothetical protein R3E79_51490 [Caldilineaceae bacterium]